MKSHADSVADYIGELLSGNGAERLCQGLAFVNQAHASGVALTAEQIARRATLA